MKVFQVKLQKKNPFFLRNTLKYLFSISLKGSLWYEEKNSKNDDFSPFEVQYHIFYCTVFTLLAIYHSLSSELLERELLTILLTTQYYCCSSFLSIERYGSAKPSVVSLCDTSFPFCDNAPSSAGVFQQHQHHTLLLRSPRATTTTNNQTRSKLHHTYNGFLH